MESINEKERSHDILEESHTTEKVQVFSGKECSSMNPSSQRMRLTILFLCLLASTQITIFLMHQPNEGAIAVQQQPEEKCEKSCSISTAMEPDDEPVVYYRGKGKGKQIALTFDDGPDNHFTPQILNILQKEKIPATFFVLGNQVKKHPNILKRMVREGHLVGNHLESHRDISKLSRNELQQEIQETERLVYQLTQKKMRLIRPPYGNINDELKDYAKKHHHSIIHWSVDPLDWDGRSKQKIMETIRQTAQKGDVILLHASGGGNSLEGTVKALPEIIRYYRSRGYQFVTIDRLFKIEAYKN